MTSNYFIFLISLATFLCAAEECILEFSQESALDDYARISNVLKSPVAIRHVLMSSDIAFSAKEFLFLTSLSDGMELTAEKLSMAIQFLRKKIKFSKIICHMKPCNTMANHVDLTIMLHGFWTFRGVEFQGMMRGRDAYNHLYGFDPGERFDFAKHRLALERITEVIKSEGYLNAALYDYFLYDDAKKEVFVRIVIDYDQQFEVRNIAVECNDVCCIKPLVSQLIMDYRYKAYTKERILQGARLVQNYVRNNGWASAIVHCVEHIDYEEKAVSIMYKIALGEAKRIILDGNHFFSTHYLYDHIFAFGSSVDHVPNDLLMQELYDIYKRKGFIDVCMSAREDGMEKTFFINEGARAVLAEVQCIGNRDFSAEYLQQFFVRVVKIGFLDEDLVQSALRELLKSYHDKGYLEARCLRHDFELLHDTSYRLNVYLDEGKQSLCTAITIPRYQALEKESFIQGFLGKAFNATVIKKQQDWLIAHFQRQGCLYVKVVPLVECRDGAANIVWEVTDDKPVLFGKPIIIGATSVPFDYLMRELVFQEGEPWSQDKLTESLQRLRKLGIFESIHLHPADIAIKEPQKNIIISLKEDSPFELRTRLGFQQVSRTFGAFHHGTTYKVGGTFVYKNPFNEVGSISADVDATKYYRNLSISYVKPWFLHRPITFQAKAYNNNYIQPVFIGSNKPLYRATQEGFLCVFTKSTKAIDAGCTLGFEAMETSDLSIEMARAIDFEPHLIDEKVPYFFMEPSLIANFLDNSLNPTRGSLSIISGKTMIPCRRHIAAFFRIIAEQSYFFSYLSSVFGLRFRFGHIFNQDFKKIMPPERFYLGGQNSIRSYQPNMAPPLGSYIDDKGRRQLVPQGGKSMLNINVEWRFPVFAGIGAVIFQDCGVLGQHSLYQAVRGGKFVAGTGFGLRYATLVGPIRFDMAFKWRRFDPQEGKYAWYLTLGQAF